MNKKLPAWAMLCAVCVVGALALGLFNGLTAGRIDQQTAILAEAVQDQALDADHFEPLEVQEGRYNLDSLYEAQAADGTVQGYVGRTTVTGYGGPIEVTAGVDNEGVITGVSVGGEGFAETPGLGARTREAAFTDQFAGKTPTLTLNEGGVDTVTGASTTSRAVVSAVNTVANYIYLNQLGLAEETEQVFMGQTFSATEQGFAGDVTVTLGFDDDGNVAYMTVDTPNETDGLGKMASEPDFAAQFIGKKGPFTYGEDGVEALTGATFTSTAAINAVNTIVNGGGEASGGPLTTTVQGFGGDVTLNVMLNDDGTVAALAIDTPNETDGLGKMTSEPAFTDQFVGKAAPFAYGEDGIEAVTGATVTSTAVINGLNDLLSGEAVPAVAEVAPAVEEAPAVEAPAEPVEGETITVDKETAFSVIHVEAVVNDGKIVDAKITSEAKDGQVDMLTDDSRAEFASQMVEKQDVDAITGVTVSSEAIKEAVSEIVGAPAAEEEAPAEEAPAAEGETVTVDKETAFSVIHVEAVVNDGKIVDAKITSEAKDGQVDMLTDDSRAEFASQMVEKQDVDAISGVTVSSEAIKEAVAEIVGAPAAEEEAPAEEEPAAEGETVTIDKETAFSVIHVEAVVNDGKIVDAKITSEAKDGQVDMLTDDSRAEFAREMVEKQDVDAITGVTVSSEAIKEAVSEIVGAPAAEEEAPAEEEPAVEGETVTIDKETAFSNLHVEATVADGKLVDVNMTSEPVKDADAEVADAPAVEEAPAAEGKTVTIDKETDFSNLHVEATVADGKLVDVNMTSEPVKDADAEVADAPAVEEAPAAEGKTATIDKETAFSNLHVEATVADGKLVDVNMTSEPVKEADAPAAEEEAPAEEAPAAEGETVTVDKETTFSVIHIEATVADGKIVDAKITSEAKDGQVDMLTDDSRAEFASQMVEKQDVDAITGVTVSSEAIKEAVAEIVGAPAAEEAPAEEAPAAEGETVTVDKETAFSVIHIEATVADGKIVDAKITSEAKDGQVDMLTDDSRAEFASQMVEKQDVDAITGVTVSSEAIKEAVSEILAK